MTTAEARTAVKSRLNIPDATTTWNTTIDDFVVSSVRRLYPRAKFEVAVQTLTSTEFTVDDLGEVTVDISALTSPILEARKVELYDGYAWTRASDTFHHHDALTIRGVGDSITHIRIYGLNQFPAITDVYDWLLQAVVWHSMAEFYDFLASNKKNYNIYMQSTGARAVDNMADQSAYYDSKADRYIEEQNQSYGL